MALSPVILFAYKRRDHLKKVLESLSRNHLSDETLLIIQCDGPKIGASSSEIGKIEEVQELSRSFKWPGEKQVIVNSENLGLSKSIITGISKVVGQYGKVIVLEDDIETSPYFLQYMNEALALYEDNDEVLAIGSCNFFAKSSKTPETFFIRIPDTWGWATWKNRWDLFEPNGSYLLSKLKEKQLLDSFNMHGAFDFQQMLRDQIYGKSDSWGIRWQALSYIHDKKVLYPGKSLTKNIGFDHEGTHARGPNKVYESVSLAYARVKVRKLPVVLDPAVENEMASTYRKMFKTTVKSKYIKPIVRKVVPVSILKLIKSFASTELKKSEPEWVGPFLSWDVAKSNSQGYESESILTKVVEATRKVVNGEALFERDSVLFNKPHYSWPLLAIFQKIVKNEDPSLRILDFGGSLGSGYFQMRAFLTSEMSLDWNVVEQEHFVNAGKSSFESGELHFYYSIEECLKEKQVDVLFVSGVLQYLENPDDWVKKFLGFGIQYVLLSRTIVQFSGMDVLAGCWPESCSWRLPAMA